MIWFLSVVSCQSMLSQNRKYIGKKNIKILYYIINYILFEIKVTRHKFP